MHREFDPADHPFEHRSNWPLYALTGIVGGLVVLDLWPLVTRALLDWLGLDLPTLANREIYGYRYALLGAIVGGSRVLYSSLERAVEGRIGADLAVAIACIAAILLGEPLVAAEVIIISLLGECLEAITFDRTQSGLKKLVELFPLRTWRLVDGQEVRVLVSELQVGDRIVVKPGGKIPVDGEILDGRSSLDTSALTGESLPRGVGPGDLVLAGSVNRDGALIILARRVAQQTVAGQVIEWTAKALKEKAPLERYADRLARGFLPAVLILAVLAFAVNVGIQLSSRTPERTVTLVSASRVALYPSLAVLVVACPCALVLATPAAIIAAIGRLAGTGILLKSGAALERLASVTHMAFDKTGTLTEGRLSIGDIVPIGAQSADELLRLAASVESRSEHPIARAIVDAARARGWAVEAASDFQAYPGQGVAAKVDHHEITIGTRRFLEDRGVVCDANVDRSLAELDATGQSALVVAREQVVLGVIGARDTLRPEAIGVLADLAQSGLTLTLLTGDRQAATDAVSRDLGLSEIHAELLPHQKAERLTSGSAFVGDGINDAPALAKSAVGIAVGHGAEIAAEAGDVLLMGEPLRPLPLLIRLSRETVRVIRQNIIWFGFGVNLIGVIISGFLWPFFATTPDVYEQAPLFGAIYHQLGSFLVLLNSMRLLAFERAANNPTLVGLRNSYRSLDRWLNTVHLDDGFHWFERNARPATIGMLGIGLLVWSALGLVQINANEIGVVQRFGAPREDLAPGLHLRWPWPIETVTKVQPYAIRSVEIGFRRIPPERIQQLSLARDEQRKLRRTELPGVTDRDLTWASGHSLEIARITDESMMITGDGNLVELLATVRYSISNPQRFLFHSRDPETLIRSHAESVFRELASGEEFLELLTANRERFERTAFALLLRRLSESTIGDPGFKLDGLTIHDLHPPQEVVASYHAVAEAIQKRDRLINEADADAIRQKRRAQEEALRIVRQSEAEAAKKLADAKAERDSFLAWHRTRTMLAEAEEAALAEEFQKRLHAGESKEAIKEDLDARRSQLLAVRRALSEFRLSLSAISVVLGARDKVFLDTKEIPGKRHFFLADPESFKVPSAMLRPTEKDP